MQRDLLVVLNTFGTWEDISSQAQSYIDTLDSVFWHVDNNPLLDVKVVISAVKVNKEVLIQLKEKFLNRITIFKYSERYTVQVSFNKTVLSTISHFNEDYNGYLYISSGLYLPKINNLFSRLINKNNSNEYGIIQLQVNTDGGYDYLGNYNNKEEDYLVPIGGNCNFHIALINKKIKDFYELPITDVHGFCSMEIGLSYISYALRKKYMILGNSECKHISSTGFEESNNDRHSWASLLSELGEVIGYINPLQELFVPGSHLLWGRTIDTFLNDKEGIESGLGYYSGKFVIDWNGIILPHDESKYGDDYLSLDPRLKESVKRNYFTNKNEINYDKINYTIYE
jgi:hypothetical protein